MHTDDPPSIPQPARHFLGWERPLLPAAASWVLDHIPNESHRADLGRTLVIVPGSRSGRLFLGMLIDCATERGTTLVPPMIITPGEAVEPLIGLPQRQAAGPVAREFAWTIAIRATPHDELLPLVDLATLQAEERPLDPVLRTLGATIDRLHTELAGHGLRVSDIAPAARELGGESEAARWNAAAHVVRRFRSILDSWGLGDGAEDRIQLAELAESDDHKAGSPLFDHVVLVGVPELPGLARRAMRVAIERGTTMHTLIHAPEELSHTFDAYGCVQPSHWSVCQLPIRDNQISVATDHADQATRAVAWIAENARGLSIDDVVIGLADESQSDLISMELQRVSSLCAHAAAGMPSSRLEPCCVLRQVMRLLETRSFDELMSLVRHPRVERWLLSADPTDEKARSRADWPSWLGELDAYDESHMPSSIDHLPPPVKDRQRAALEFIVASVRLLLGNLWTDQESVKQSEKPPEELAEGTFSLLNRLYGHLTTSRTDRVLAPIASCCMSLADDLNGIITLAKKDAVSLPHQTPAHFLSNLLGLQAARAFPSPPDADAIEIVGWLELAHDPSPLAVVVGMTDNNVPGTREYDSMLPGSLRTRLGLPASTDRLARDSFLAATMTQSRRHALFIAPRRDNEGSPLNPSRILLRSDRGSLAGRMRRTIGREGDGPLGLEIVTRSSSRELGVYRVAPRIDTPPVQSMRVTAFKDYLASPYAFYLRHVLRLSEHGRAKPELDPRSFGTFVHDVLESFGRSDTRHSTDEKAIREFVQDDLRTLARERFGSSSSAIISLQVEHASMRLDQWATMQAEWARAGWRILHTEWSATEPRDGTVADPPTIRVEEGSVTLRGKIDRIDIHESDDRIAILDYKSSENARSPEKTHRTRDGEWRDLQLPLYRELIRPLGLRGEITLGYFNIPRNLDEIGITVAPWTAEELDSADDAARDVVSAVLRGEFDEIGSPSDEGTLGLIAGLGILTEVDAPTHRRPSP